VTEQPSSVLIEVQSEGPRIQEHEIDRIFERGYRADAAIRAYPSGMGVGLYVCDIIAKAHGTRINVRSDALGFEVGGVEQGRSVFKFEIRNVIVSASSGQR
jgi:signal transduction histidine kinase